MQSNLFIALCYHIYSQLPQKMQLSILENSYLLSGFIIVLFRVDLGVDCFYWFHTSIINCQVLYINTRKELPYKLPVDILISDYIWKFCMRWKLREMSNKNVQIPNIHVLSMYFFLHKILETGLSAPGCRGTLMNSKFKTIWK